MPGITYYMGAGASCESMPLVKTFRERFELFMNFVDSFPQSENRDKFGDLSYSFLDELKKHISFDTFFKKLFHKRAEKSIQLYKNVLLIYFIFEHLVDDEYLDTRPRIPKVSSIEKRYDALIAGLLQPYNSSTKFYNTVNFITWNYDLILLNTLKSFFFNEIGLDELIKGQMRFGKILDIQDQGLLIHMNGLIYHDKLSDIKTYPKKDLVQFLGSLMEGYYETDSMLSEFSKKICFAWETLDSVKDISEDIVINEARKVLEVSDCIVIIGYSFPLYNRVVDQYLFSQDLLERKKVYIQDIYSDKMMRVFRENFSLKNVYLMGSTNPGPGEFMSIDECDSFFVPNTIFATRK